jgi:hypothetical protein
MNMIQHDGVLGTKPPTATSHPGGSGKYEFEVKIRSAVEGNPAVVWKTSSSKPASSPVARNNATKDVVAHYKDAMVQGRLVGLHASLKRRTRDKFALALSAVVDLLALTAEYCLAGWRAQRVRE